MTENIRVMVKFKKIDVKSKEAVDMVSLLYNATIVHTHDIINVITMDVPKDKLEMLKKDSNVEYVEEDQEAHILVSTTVKKNSLPPVNVSNIVPWGVIKIRAPEVHSEGNKGSGIKCAIIDTGIDYTHINLKDNYKGGYNFIANTNDPKDDNGHGSHVAGIVGARDIGNGLVGVAPEIDIYSLKVLDSTGSGSYSNIIAAIQWCIDNKMLVINMSFGGSGFSQAMFDICDAAYNSGIVLIAAAGNSGSGTDTIGYPAKFSSVVAVGAVDSNDVRASFSSTGPEMEICAPGVSIPSSVPNGTCQLCDSSGFKNLSGTSMACPHVVGTAALILKADPTLTSADVIIQMTVNSVELGLPGRDNEYGSGRVDAKAAVDNIPPPPPSIPKTWNCSGSPDYQCVEVSDGTGKYKSLEACVSACKKPVVVKNKYMVQPLGKSGVLVLKTSVGKYSADEAIAKVTEIIKQINV